MTEQYLFDLSYLLPELFLFLGTILLLLIGLYGSEDRDKTVETFSAVVLLGSLAILIKYPVAEPVSLLNEMLVLDGFVQFSKVLIVLGAFLALALSSYWFEQEGQRKFEFYLLILLATIGMMLMVSSSNLISVYMALELTSLSLYVLAAFRRDSLRSTEAGLKYFILGSLASGMMLFGMSFVYGFTGSTSFEAIAGLLQNVSSDPAEMLQASYLGVLMGMVMILVGLCFKVSAVPFHMWTPDVYQGAPTPVVAFFAVAPKIAALVLFARILMQPFGGWVDQWQQIIIFVSIASMVVGGLGALVQTNIKRMLAYSSIGHVGYALVALAAGTEAGMQALLIYLAIYLFMSIGAFGCVLLMQRDHEAVEEIDQLSGLSKRHPRLAMILAIFMFSLAGIPPLAGFFGKMYVFLAALEAGLFTLTVIGVLASVISAFYYLRIVKLMYFDEEKEPLSFELTTSLRYTLMLCAAVAVFFFLFPAPLVESAKQAASTLWL